MPGEGISGAAGVQGDRRRRAVISVPAVIGYQGVGQGGLKIARSLLSTGAWDVFAVAERAAGELPFPVRSVPIRPLMSTVVRTPIRMREDWLISIQNYAFDLLARSRVERSDVFYGYSESALYCGRKARALGALTVLHAANTYLPTMRRRLLAAYHAVGERYPPVGPWSVHKVLREYAEFDVIRAQSTLVRDSLLEGGIPESKVCFVPPAVDSEDYRPSARQPNAFTTAFVGTFSVRKGIHHLLQAWDALSGDRGRLILHGGWATRWGKRLIMHYQNRQDIELRGGVPHHTYADASVCVAPSLEDGFCYVVIEAMACGVPVIVSDQVGAKDAIRDGIEGFVVPAGDWQAIRDRLAYLRDHPAERQRMAVAARARAVEFSFQAEGARLTQVFAR